MSKKLIKKRCFLTYWLSVVSAIGAGLGLGRDFVQTNRNILGKFKSNKPLVDTLAILLLDFLCEFVGMFYFMFIGCSCLHTSRYKIWSYPGGVIGFCFIIASCVQFMQFTTGGHLNPSVTLAFFLMGHFSIYRALALYFGQLSGSIVGFFILKQLSVYNSETDSHWCCTAPSQDSIVAPIIWEFLSTSFLLMLIYSIVDGNNKYGNSSLSIKVGVVLMATIYPVAEYCGCSMNPVRSLAPALILNCWDSHWVYWIGPLSASVVTSQLWLFLFSKSNPDGSKSSIASGTMKSEN